ncbi:MAG: hypothetical protein R3E08_05680 [Thiotrichaceae bacterium]
MSKAQANTEAMARQAAAVGISDGYITTGPADVKASAHIIADANTNANCKFRQADDVIPQSCKSGQPLQAFFELHQQQLEMVNPSLI